MRAVQTQINFNVHNFIELQGVTDWISEKLKPKGVLFLSGEVGVGKTKTVEWLLKGWGVRDVASPTYALHHSYQTSEHLIDHFDFYRLKTSDEINDSGFWDVLTKNTGYVIVEWPHFFSVQDIPEDWNVVDVKIYLTNDVREFRCDFYAAFD